MFGLYGMSDEILAKYWAPCLASDHQSSSKGNCIQAPNAVYCFTGV